MCIRDRLAGASSPKVIEAGLVAARLRALVRPFVLRRTRAEVLDDLPPRQEIDLVCPLPAAHRHLYDALAVVLRDEVRHRDFGWTSLKWLLEEHPMGKELRVVVERELPVWFARRCACFSAR